MCRGSALGRSLVWLLCLGWVACGSTAPRSTASIDAASTLGADSAGSVVDTLSPDVSDAVGANDVVAEEDITDALSQDAPTADTHSAADGQDGGYDGVDAGESDTASQEPDVDVVDAGCVPTPEQCDGADNDCDGLTDEDFALTVGPGLSFQVGDSCDNPTCPKGVIVCANKKYAWCSTCPQPIPKSVVLAPTSASKSPLTAQGGFVEVTGVLAAIAVEQGSPTFQPEGSAVLAVDLDGDDDLDLVATDGKDTVQVFVQQGPWSFTTSQLMTNSDGVRAIAALPLDAGPPLILAGGGGLWAWQGSQAKGWKEVSKALGLSLPVDAGPVSHLLPADVDADGLMDLVVSLFPCSANSPGLLVFRARGDGGFEEISKTLGLSVTASLWATLQTDWNGDGRQDLMVLTESCQPLWGAGMFLAPSKGPVETPYKLTTLKGVFTQPTNPTELSPMGAATADVNGDGVYDYLLSEIQLWGYAGKVNPLDLDDPWLYADKSNIYLLSQPQGGRARAGLHAGLWAPLSASSKPMVAWTPAWSDLDHDGHLDLLLSHAPHYDAWLLNDLGGMRPVIFRNDGQGHFDDVSFNWGLPSKHAGRSLVLADLDGDGDQDLIVGGMATPPKVWRNELKHAGSDLSVRLSGTVSNLWGLGARLELSTNQRVIVAEHSLGAVTQAMGPPRTHFALRSGEQAGALTVTWPSGVVQTLSLQKVASIEVQEPSLLSVSKRWLPGGQGTFKVSWLSAGPGLSGCAPTVLGSGSWQGSATCDGASCSRTWAASAAAGSFTEVRLSCGAFKLKVGPKVFH